MAEKTKTKAKQEEPKRYLETVPRKWVYWPLGIIGLVVLCLFLFVPHYKPVHLASQQELADTHKAIIQKYFLRSTICVNDNRDRAGRVIEFNKYFKVNQYANRAVIRGCNDNDTLLAKDDSGQWQRTDVNIVLSTRQNPQWQKACYIDDITIADTKVRPENSSIDANNLKICKSLAKESYIELNLKASIHFHF